MDLADMQHAILLCFDEGLVGAFQQRDRAGDIGFKLQSAVRQAQQICRFPHPSSRIQARPASCAGRR